MSAASRPRLPTRAVRVVSASLLGVALGAVLGCPSWSEPPPPADPSLDEAFFRCRVQPILTKNCSTFACHGDARRPFSVFARNRLRLGGTERERNAFLGDDERTWNYRAAAAMVDLEHRDESPLLMKPLDVAAGGWFHGATELEGRQDVFADREGEWGVMSEWVHGATQASDCVEPGSDL